MKENPKFSPALTLELTRNLCTIFGDVARSGTVISAHAAPVNLPFKHTDLSRSRKDRKYSVVVRHYGLKRHFCSGRKLLEVYQRYTDENWYAY